MATPTPQQLVDQYKVSGNLTPGQITGNAGNPPVFAGTVPVANASASQSSSIITPDTNAPVTPLTIPAPASETASAGLSGRVDALKEAQKAQAETQAKLDAAAAEAKAKADTSTKNLEDVMAQYLGVQGQRPTLEANAGLDKKAQAVTDVTNRIEASQRAQQNEIRALDNQPLTLGDKSQRIADINRKYAMEQADLAVIQSAANRDYATAQAIVDSKINAQLEPLKTKLDFLKMFYDANQSAFDKADQRAFELKIASDTQAYNLAADQAKTLEDAKMKAVIEAQTNGAPTEILSAIQRATTPEEAYAAGGQYIGLLDRQYKNAQIAKLNDKSGTGAGTESERATAAVAKYSQVIVPGAKLPDGTPVLDQNGYMTPVAWKEAIKDAPSNGLSREAFIKQFGNYIFTDNGVIPSSYGLTPVEMKLITGSTG